MIRSLTHREQMLGLVGFCVILVTLGYFEGAIPLWERWERVDRQAEIMVRRLARDRQVLAQAKDIRAAYEQQVGGAFVPRSEEEASGAMLQAVDRIASSVGSGVRIRELKARATVNEGDYRILGVEIEAEGQLPNLARLVYELEHAKEGFRVTRLQVQALGDDALEGTLLVTQPVVGLSGG